MPTFNHTGQVVTDLERAKRFYTEVLGFKYWREGSPSDDATSKLNQLEPPLGIQTCYLCLDGFVIELMYYSAPGAVAEYRRRTMNEPGLTHLSIGVPDIRATAEKAVEYGGEILEDTEIGGMVIFIRDPDGQLLELLPESYADQLTPKPQAVQELGAGSSGSGHAQGLA